MRRPRSGQGTAKMKADLEKKSKKKKNDLKIDPKTGVHSNYKNTYKKMSFNEQKNLTDRQKSGDDEVRPGWKVNKGPGGGLRPSRRPRKRSYVK